MFHMTMICCFYAILVVATRSFMFNGYTISFYHSQTQQTLSYGVHYIRKPEILRLQHLYSPY
jgi:hypothetical protein